MTSPPTAKAGTLTTDEALRQSHADLRSQTQELLRFNRAAVGRELRVIELKTEVNELRRQQGAAARYPLGFEKRRTDAGSEPPCCDAPRPESPNALVRDSLLPLESILCTEELNRRPARPPDYETENRALGKLTQALADSPHTILQTLADTVLDIFGAGSAGLSLLTKDQSRFFWPAISGAWQQHVGGGTPRDFGPCGDVLDRNAPLLFKRFERRYPYLLAATPAVEECLLIPFHVKGQAVGTIWAMAHDSRRKFDAEDLRQLESLGRFAAAAYQAVEFQGAFDQRQAALSLLEDSVEARQAMEKLHTTVRESEERYRRLFESAHDGILILDAAQGKIIDANPFMARLLGYTHAEFLGRELWEIGLFKDRSGSEVVARELREMGYSRYENLPLSTKSGNQVEVEVIANVYQEGLEQVIQCNIRDITERSRLKRKTQEQAEALSDLHRRKDEFIAMLSHELRNPLAPILSAVHLLTLQKGNENQIQQRARIIIERQVGQLSSLVDDLLDISRIATGRIQLRFERLDMRVLVQRAVETTRPLIDRRKHQLALSVSEEPLWLNGDPTRLEQILVNLINNAAKYTEAGGHVTVIAAREAGAAVVRVRDTGAGIAADMLPHVFDLFAQADQSLDRSQGGLGIGLSIVQRLTALHGGTVEAHSAGLGKGSEFVVSVPLSVLIASPNAALGEDPAANAPRHLRALVVDDNEDAAETLSAILGMLHHDVRVAFDGETAFALAIEYRPDVVFMDIGLPGIDGYEVARRLRLLPDLNGMVLIALTGYGEQSSRDRSKEAGFDHHWVKPVPLQRITEFLSSALTELPSPGDAGCDQSASA
jgi:PAS domain S-box-containing protein